MALKSIKSLDELMINLNADSRNYVLLYKRGSENSDCSFKSLSELIEDGVNVNVLAVDVNEVRDIHIKYDITTVPSLLVFNGTKFENAIKGCNDKNYYKSLFTSTIFSAKNDDGKTTQKQVTVYSTPTCSWCTTLKTHLKNNGIRYAEIDVSKNTTAAETMKRKSGQQGVPQTEINGEMVVGFDKNKINRLLNIQ